jgi:trimeric autotransporter adhesin
MKNKSSFQIQKKFFAISLSLLVAIGLASTTGSGSVSALPETAIPYHYWASFGSGYGQYVSAIYVDGTDIYVGGQFTDLGGVSGATNIARWDGSAWHALDTGLEYGPSAIIRVGSWIYAGGSFKNAGGDPDADNLARWDGNAWSSLGGNNLAGANDMVFDLETDGTKLFVAGQFANAAGIPDADTVAVWDGSAWFALGTGLPGAYVRSLALYDGQLYAGGTYTFLAHFDGASWSYLPGLTSPQGDIYLYPVGNDLYVGGAFLNAGSIDEADHIARWDGSNWHALGNGLNGSVYALAGYGSNLIVSGTFTDAGGNPNADILALWDGAAWQDMGGGMTGYVGSFSWQGNDLYTGGSFDDAHGDPLQDNLIVWKTGPQTYLPMVIKP